MSLICYWGVLLRQRLAMCVGLVSSLIQLLGSSKRDSTIDKEVGWDAFPSLLTTIFVQYNTTNY